MTAQEAKAKLLVAIKEIIDAGFYVGGHWDDEIILVISRGQGETWEGFGEDYDEITTVDL